MGISLFSESIKEALEAEASRRDMTPEAVLVDLLAELLPEAERWKAYLEAARASIEHARKAVTGDQIPVALRHAWSAMLLALISFSLRESGETPTGIGDYWSASSRAGDRDPRVYYAWYAALAARIMLGESIDDIKHAKQIVEPWVAE